MTIKAGQTLTAEWRDKLGLTHRRTPELYESAESAVGVPHAPAIRAALDDMGLSAVFCVQGVPTVGILVADHYDQAAVVDLHAELWNQGLASLLLVITDDTIRAFSLARTPLEEPGRAFEPRCLIDALDLTAEVMRIRGLIDGAESGRLWRDYGTYFPPKERIDQVLLDNLKVSHKLLQADGLSSDAAQALLIQAMFIAYLEDREIATPAYFEAVSNNRVRSFSELLATGDVELLRALFRTLREDFNGDLFVAPCSFEPQAQPPKILPEHLYVLGRFRSGREEMASGGQQRFWGYDFRFIPIELVSAVYDRFLGEREEERRAKGAFYTPMFLADTIVSQVWEVLPERVCDGRGCRFRWGSARGRHPGASASVPEGRSKHALVSPFGSALQDEPHSLGRRADRNPARAFVIRRPLLKISGGLIPPKRTRRAGEKAIPSPDTQPIGRGGPLAPWVVSRYRLMRARRDASCRGFSSVLQAGSKTGLRFLIAERRLDGACRDCVSGKRRAQGFGTLILQVEVGTKEARVFEFGLLNARRAIAAQWQERYKRRDRIFSERLVFAYRTEEPIGARSEMCFISSPHAMAGQADAVPCKDKALLAGCHYQEPRKFDSESRSNGERSRHWLSSVGPLLLQTWRKHLAKSAHATDQPEPGFATVIPRIHEDADGVLQDVFECGRVERRVCRCPCREVRRRGCDGDVDCGGFRPASVAQPGPISSLAQLVARIRRTGWPGHACSRHYDASLRV